MARYSLVAWEGCAAESIWNPCAGCLMEAGAELCSFTSPPCVVEGCRRPDWGELPRASRVPALVPAPVLVSSTGRERRAGPAWPIRPQGREGSPGKCASLADRRTLPSCALGRDRCEPSSLHLREEPAAWPKWGMRARVCLGISVWKPLLSRGTWDGGYLP